MFGGLLVLWGKYYKDNVRIFRGLNTGSISSALTGRLELYLLLYGNVWIAVYYSLAEPDRVALCRSNKVCFANERPQQTEHCHAALKPLLHALSSKATEALCLCAMQSFDELLLLKRGGQTIYFGPTGERSAELVSYFESVPGVPQITDGANPATWMLEVSHPLTQHAVLHPG